MVDLVLLLELLLVGNWKTKATVADEKWRLELLDLTTGSFLACTGRSVPGSKKVPQCQFHGNSQWCIALSNEQPSSSLCIVVVCR